MDILFFDRRPIFLFGITALVGVYIATGESTVQALILAVALLIGAYIKKTNYRYIIAAVFVGIIFFLLGAFAENAFDEAYSKANGKKCAITGTIASVDSIKEKYTLITLRPDGFMMKKIKVYIFDNALKLIQGDRLVTSGTLSKPERATNPGGYDARKVMYGDGAAAYIFSQAEDTRIQNGFSIGKVFGLIRMDIRNKCIELLKEERGAILTGMLIGDKAGLDPALKDSFRESGLSHTMAVSGSHVAYILAPLMFLFSKLGIERRKYYPWILMVLLFFAILTGLQPSVARASLTAALMLIAGIVSEETDPLNSLGLSALLLMAINPFTIYDAGFILSYACVLSIFLFYKPLAGLTGRSPVGKMLALTLAVQIGVIPVTAKLFYSIQLFSVISNLLIFPVRAVLAISGWIMYFISGIFMPLARVFSLIVGMLTDSVFEVAVLFGNNTVSSINVPYIPGCLIVLYFISAYMALHMKKHSIIPIAVCIIVISGYMIFFSIPKNTYVFYDSGQADCFLIKTNKGKDLLIDTGKYADGNSLAHFCGDYIDCIFLTHAHQDHIGGLLSILNRFRVGKVFIPNCKNSEMNEVLEMCRKKGVQCIGLAAGDRLKADDYVIEVLNPVNKDYLSLNDTSLVIKLVYEDKSLLFCGDIEMPAELDILSSGYDLDSDIFKVPHHGAKGSAYGCFYGAVSPKISIISSGKNYFGHPSQESLDLLDGTEIYRTDINGAIIIKADKEGYKVTLYNK